MAPPMKAKTAVMKVMKVMKESGVMKPKWKRPSRAMKAVVQVEKATIASGRLSKAMVYQGRRDKTAGGLKASDIIRNKRGKFVFKKASLRGVNASWIKALAAARKALGLKGFVKINKGPDGQALYAKAKALHQK
mmetsp:Transcript_173726/g.422537  ORF Transcript_173726/g.422537 Transcript_173726/m.422537 type:complete len:134 (+) Transcript_173726:89-490(+)